MKLVNLQERIKLPRSLVPPIIDAETYALVQERLRNNRKNAARNNQHPEQALLRGGYAICGYCRNTMNAHNRCAGDNGADYRCKKGNFGAGECKKVTISCRMVDDVAWEHACEIIKDPNKVQQKLEAKKVEYQRDGDLEHVDNELSKIAKEVENLAFLGKTAPDKQVLETLGGLLNDLTRQRLKYEKMREALLNIEEKRKKDAETLAQFEKKCAMWRWKLKEPGASFTYQEKREAIEFFGIKALVWRSEHKPRFEIPLNPQSIESIRL